MMLGIQTVQQATKSTHQCPYAVQMALATNRMGARKGSETAIASREMIVAQNAASEALRGLGQRRGGDRHSLPWSKGKATSWDGKRTQPASRIFDATLL